MRTVRADWHWITRMLTVVADARGHYTIGKELVDTVIDRIRRVAGTCSCVVCWSVVAKNT